jgi:hypothetical protein
MNYSKFSSNLNKTLAGVDIHESIYIFGHTIQKTIDGTILIDNKETYCKDLSEAKRYIIQQINADDIQQEIIDEVYTDNIPKIVNIIKEEHGIRITDAILEHYIKLASNKVFTIDPIVEQIRELNKFDNVIAGKIQYVLEDNTTIAINNETQEILNSTLKPDAIEYMRENAENFLKILGIIIKEQ